MVTFKRHVDFQVFCRGLDWLIIVCLCNSLLLGTINLFNRLADVHVCLEATWTTSLRQLGQWFLRLSRVALIPFAGGFSLQIWFTKLIYLLDGLMTILAQVGDEPPRHFQNRGRPCEFYSCDSFELNWLNPLPSSIGQDSPWHYIYIWFNNFITVFAFNFYHASFLFKTIEPWSLISQF